MKKYLMMFVAVFVALAVASPVLAAVEFKYGGQFRVRYTAEDNIFDGTDDVAYFQGATGASFYNARDNAHFMDQRLRLYFTFVASQNLKLVTRFEVGSVRWGDGGGASSGPGTGGNVGADAVSIEVKNVYFEFNIPSTPTTALMGIQTITLLDSWIIDDDFSAAMFVTKLDPFRLTLGYVAGQSGWEGNAIPGGFAVPEMKYTSDTLNVNDFVAALDYKQGPFSGNLVFFYQGANETVVSFDPTTLNTPVRSAVGNGLGKAWLNPARFDNEGIRVTDNNLFDIGFNVTYKVDYLKAYVSFVKNFGGVELANDDGDTKDVDYEGWMIDAGVTYFCGPWTVNLGGFYTSGAELRNDDANDSFWSMNNGNKIAWFTYPLATSKYFSEIIGGGILSDDFQTTISRGYPNSVAGNAVGGVPQVPYWRGYGFPSNLWTVTVGGSYQLAEKTKLSASYWYFASSEAVPVRWNEDSELFSMGNSIGHELDFYVDQGITDGLTLTLVGAYLFAEDAYCPVPSNVNPNNAFSGDGTDPTPYTKNYAEDSYKVGFRLLWNF